MLDFKLYVKIKCDAIYGAPFCKSNMPSTVIINVTRLRLTEILKACGNHEPIVTCIIK